MRQDSDPEARKFHRENAERMLLAAFVAGLAGEIGKQVRFQNPQNLHRALTTALAFREAVKQESFAETFYTKFDKSVTILSREGSEADERSSTKRASNHSSGKRYARNIDRMATSGNVRDVQERSETRC